MLHEFFIIRHYSLRAAFRRSLAGLEVIAMTGSLSAPSCTATDEPARFSHQISAASAHGTSFQAVLRLAPRPHGRR